MEVENQASSQPLIEPSGSDEPVLFFGEIQEASAVEPLSWLGIEIAPLSLTNSAAGSCRSAGATGSLNHYVELSGFGRDNDGAFTGGTTHSLCNGLTRCGVTRTV